MMSQSKLRVLMVGESPNLRGGIASVQKLILESISPEIVYTHIATVSAYPSDPNLPKIIVFCRSLGMLLICLLRQKHDLIHIHISERGSVYRKLIVASLGLVFRTPTILHTHGSEFHLFYPKQPQIIKWLINRVFSRCNGFIVLSESWKKFYIDNIRLSPSQVIVMPNPVKIPLQIPNRHNSNKVKFVFLGRIGQRKGAFDLIRAFATLPTHLLNCSELVLAGDGDGDEARSLVEELNLGNCVVFDWLSSHQRDELLAESHVFVLPSYNEGLPMALLEAMSWALPVITTPVGGIPELIQDGHNGFLVNPGDMNCLSQVMQKLIQDESLRLVLGHNAINSVKPYGIEKYCSFLTETYKSISSFK